MSKREILVGSTDQTIDIFVQDSSSSVGAGLAALVYNTSGLKCYYRKGATGSATQLTLATQTVGGAHSDGGFVEIDATNMKGVYRLDLSDTIVAAAGMVTIYLYGATNMMQCVAELEVVNVNKFDATRMGLTALPNANAEAAGGLYTRGTGAGQINQPANGQIDSNAVAISGDSTAADNTEAFFDGTGYNASNSTVGTVTTVTNRVTADVDRVDGAALGTHAAGYFPGDIRQYGGTAGTFASGRPEVNTTHLGGSTTPVTNLGVVYNTDFATNYDSTNDRWTVNVKTWNDLTTVALPLVPTTAGRTLDVSTGGEAGVDWANIGSPTTTVGLSGTTVKTATDVETDTNEIQQKLTGTGAVTFASLTVFGATTLTGNVAMAAGLTITQSTTDGSGVSVTGNGSGQGVSVTGGATGLGALISGGSSSGGSLKLTVPGSSGIGLQVIAAGNSNCVQFASAGSGACFLINSSGGSGIALDLATSVTAVRFQGNVSVEGTTGLTGAVTANSASNDITGIDVKKISGDATAADNAEAFFDGTGYAGTNNVIPTVTTLTGHTPQTGDSYPIVSSGVHGNAAIKGYVDDIGIAGAGLSSIPWNSAWDAEVQSEVEDALTAYGASTLNAASVRSAVGLASANLDTQLGTIDDFLDTEIAAIKAKTDNLPSDPADASDIAAAFSAVTAALAALLTTAQTESYRGTNATGSVVQLLYEILQNVTEFSISGTTKTVKKLDGSTTAKTYTLNQSPEPTAITETT